ncbi:MAG: hypothetical protein M0R06_17190 [Sphaerochaeta sp.]|jgi:hypothetical protein|nr:hypothetical protein [Sphaerochaeta sp.]
MLKYIGNGASLPHIPARDLRDDEVEGLGGEEFLESTGLYINNEITRRIDGKRFYPDKPVRRAKSAAEPNEDIHESEDD